ncbi:MAG: 30S ribosomal protein S4 [Candidatus Komeilibacteria bacterium]|nr:30S ribosomal protein S4 [Candidatus Komeilibacteria bacterium]
MARDLAPKYKRSRREGVELHPDLDRANTAKSPLARRRYFPGVHGPKGGWNKQSNYGVQLREKQKAKRIYGVLERQFRNYYEKAIKKEGDTGEVMLGMLESRLDNVIYRLGFAKTRPAARQMVNHGHILVDGKKLSIPSAQIAIGSAITPKAKIADSPVFAEKIKAIDRSLPGWLTRDKAQGKVVAKPDLSDAKQMVDMRLIIEFYSR